jgi:chromosome segregation ATPase
MTRRASPQSLQKQLKDLEDRHAQLLSTFQLQQEHLAKADQTSASLQAIVERAQAGHAEISRRCQSIREDLKERQKQFDTNNEAMKRATTRLVEDITKPASENDRTRKVLNLRVVALARQWEPIENNFLKTIGELEQRSSMSRAKMQEVRPRVERLRNRPRPPTAPVDGLVGSLADFGVGVPEDQAVGMLSARLSSLGGQPRFASADREAILAEYEEMRIEVEGKKAKVGALTDECRALQHQRDELQKKKNEAANGTDKPVS